MSTPFDGALRSAGVATPFADEQPQESDDEDEENSDSEGGILSGIGGTLGRAGDAFQSGVDTVFDSGPVPLQDYATYAIGTTTDTEDPASEEGRQQTAEDLSRGFGVLQEGSERFVTETSPVAGAIDATAGEDSTAASVYDSTVDFGGDVAFGLPRDLATVATGVDTRTGERDEDVSPYLAIDALSFGLAGRGLVRGAGEASDAARAADTAATNSDTMASRFFRGLSRVSPFGRRSAGRSDDVVESLDDFGSSGTRTVDNFDEVDDTADDLPVLFDDSARSANDAARGADDALPVVRGSDEVGDSSGLFDGVSLGGVTSRVGSGLDDLGGSIGRGVDSVTDTITSNPRRSALAGGATVAGAGAYAYAPDASDISLGGGGGDGAGSNSGVDDGAEGSNPPNSFDFDFSGDPLSADWSMDDMGPRQSQTIEVRVTNETNRSASIALYLTAEIDGDEYIVDETTTLTLGRDKSSGYRGSYTSSESAQKAYQLNLSSPGANGITGRTRFNLYATGQFDTQAGAPAELDLGSETITIAEGRGESGDGAAGWSNAQQLYSLQYGWHLFGQRREGGEREMRYMVAGKMEDGSTRYLNESGAIVDSPDYFDSEQDAIDAHAEWVERLQRGETGTTDSTTPGGTGRPNPTRVTEDAGGGGGGGSLSNITKATGVSGNGWDVERIARLTFSVGLLAYVLNRYDIINIGSWPVIGEVV